ncbi:bpX6 domain-containing protein [Pseudomonas sp. CAN2814]|uniref:bpX6 domain-containing protein n=1 Tax=Pseudomonas sp. CAN1 TaxID=3046726 RepID=UPI002647B0B3|nr:bpX6 domain-containing protein [Pseudomonas sp. CAN1]MDN6860379.1 bpX6 domain-containing protein [Pseudomonas sp. CAN1]
MPEQDVMTIRRPLLTGHQAVEGLWFPAERFDEGQRARLLFDNWRVGASAFRFDAGDLLRFSQPLSAQCETLLGWPLVRQGRSLSSALLTAEEVRAVPVADLWLVRGSRIDALHLSDASQLQPGQWIDLGAYALLNTYDCSGTLPEPVLDPIEVNTDLRVILGDVVGPASPERAEVMRALQERRQDKPQGKPGKPGKVAQGRGGAARPGIALPALRGPAFAAAIFALTFLAQSGKHGGPVAIDSVSASTGLSLVPLMLVGALLFFLLVLGIGLWQRRPLPGQVRPVATAATQPPIAPRKTPAQPRTAAWRRWVSRLTRHSQLRALYGKRQAAYMRRMLEMFENGDLQEALRHAIPLGGEFSGGEQAFGTPGRRQELTVSGERGAGRSMMFEADLQTHLKQIYRHSFERLDREGRIEEAVFVLAELLQVRQEALDYLEKHGRLKQAAELALAWDMPAGVIVRMLCLADDWKRALQVARRDDAFAAAVTLLQAKWPESANRLRLEWAEALTAKGLWLQAVEVIWELPEERERAAQWLLSAEEAGGTLAIGALVKRAVLLPDTLVAYGPWVEQLRDDPERSAERAALARALLQHKTPNGSLAWLARAVVHAVLADQSAGVGRLDQRQLQGLVKLSRDKLLRADLPAKAPTYPPVLSLGQRDVPLRWTAPEMGSRVIFDAVVLDDGRYLVALGEAGSLVLDAGGRTLIHFPLPAQRIVLAHSRQTALVLARRDDVWRIGKLDLVNRSASDRGVLALDVFARSFDGIAWTVGRGTQLRVVDVERNFETLWHVSDLPGRLLALREDAYNEFLLLGAERGGQLWHYRLPERRLLSRLPMPEQQHPDGCQLFTTSAYVAEYRLLQTEDDAVVLSLSYPNADIRLPLPGLDPALLFDDPVSVHEHEYWLLVGHRTSAQDTAWTLVHRRSGRPRALLDWPQHAVQVRCDGADWLLFDQQGRLSHLNVEKASQHNLSIN